MKTHRIRLNISQKFVIYLILLSTIPMLIVGVASLNVARNILQNEAERYSLEIVTNQRDFLELELEQFETLLLNISSVEDIRNSLDDPQLAQSDYANLATHAKIGYILNSFSNLNGLVSIDIFTVDGRHFHVGDTLNVDDIREDVKDGIFNRALRSNERIVWTGIEDNVNVNSSQDKVLTAAKILYRIDPDTLQEEPLALLLANFSVEHVYEHFSSINLGENANFLIFDNQRRIIYHPNPAMIGQQVNADFVQQFTQNKGTTELTIDGQDTVVSYAKSAISGWTVAGLIPAATFTRGIQSIQRILLLVLLASFFVVSAAALVYRRQVAGPIREITNRFKQVKQGNGSWPEKIRQKSQDEIGELVQWFNTFMETMQAHRQAEAEVTKYNRQLLALQNISLAISSSQDLEFVLQTIGKEMALLLHVDACAITEWDRESDSLKLLTEFGPGDWWYDEPEKPVYYLADYPLSAQVLTRRQPVQLTLNTPNADPAEVALLRQYKITSRLMLPMIYQDRVIGLVELFDRAEMHFSDNQITLAQLLANQAATAIENLRLYQQARQEVADRRRAEAQITESLREKEILIKEIHHRVKNNLQIISSMLNLQSRYVTRENALDAFAESQNRVRSMALIHEKLYQSESLARIDFGEYIESLTSYLFRTYTTAAGKVTLKTHIESIVLGLDTAVPCGLLINELVTNALKHGYPNGQKGEICVDFRLDDNHNLNLVVSNSGGVAFPDGLNIHAPTSLGLQIVNALVNQLDGTVELATTPYTSFKISFPFEDERAQ
ncbi:MAG: GAF domain-containing protein [Chloroflexi bacterium]|nr:MAG: GAF domain-containing protein [Chloroflexota bacterium]